MMMMMVIDELHFQRWKIRRYVLLRRHSRPNESCRLRRLQVASEEAIWLERLPRTPPTTELASLYGLITLSAVHSLSSVPAIEVKRTLRPVTTSDNSLS